MAPVDADVVVVGAGIAGLSAARDLAGCNLAVTVLEARPRAGGRILTEHPSGWPTPVELGAEFVHGSPADLIELARAAGAHLEPAESMHLWRSAGGLEPMEGFWAEISALIDGLRPEAPDCSAAELLARSPLSAHAGEMLALFIEGFHAAALERISWRSVARQMAAGDQQQWRIAEGYDRLVEFSVADAGRQQVQLVGAAPVTAVRWRPGRVEAQVGGCSVRASALVLALPVSVLAASPDAGGIAFDPELPRLRAALAALEMGQALRVVVRLGEPVWPEGLPAASFVHGAAGELPTCWISGDGDHPQATLWCGGTRAAALIDRGAGWLQQAAIRSLAGLFDRPVDEIARCLLSAHVHLFGRDRWARGAYPFLRAGASIEGGFEPEAGTLFVAGDFTDPDELGTVGAAVRSGRAAARAARAALGA